MNSCYKFDIAKFRTLFPVFADIEKFTDEQLTYAWEDTLLQLSMPYSPATERLYYIYTAHLLYLWAVGNNYEGFTLKQGLTSSASIGDISTSVESRRIPNMQEYYLMQSPYGEQYLLRVKRLASFEYYPNKGVECQNPVFPISRSSCIDIEQAWYKWASCPTNDTQTGQASEK